MASTDGGQQSFPSRSMYAQVYVEEDPNHRSVYGKQKDSLNRALYSAIVTLTLGVLGSTVLPVPYAFSKLGILPGCLTMAVVAAANDRTCCMLVKGAAVTGRYTYEQLAEWAGGRKARILTQVSLILLLYGTLCGGLAFLSDVARMMALKGIPDSTSSTPQQQQQQGSTGLDPGAADNNNLPLGDVRVASGTGSFLDGLLPLMRSDGRPLMLVVVATVLYPMCLMPHIRQFEKAATVGVVVVVALMAIIVGKAVSLGFPAVRSGQLPVWGFHRDAGAALPEAFAVLGFAFYMQPMLMPLLAEMPTGPAGTALSQTAVHIVLFGVACSAYGVVGVFGAATYGDATESNIMVNDILAGHPTGTLLLYGSLLIYLCCGMVTTHFALRTSLEVLLMGKAGEASTRARVVMTSGILVAALAVACSFPTQAERIFAFTGCTAVCLVCYVLPCYIHVKIQNMSHVYGPHVQRMGSHGSRKAARRMRTAAGRSGGNNSRSAVGEYTRESSLFGSICEALPDQGSGQLKTPLLDGGGNEGVSGASCDDLKVDSFSSAAGRPDVVAPPQGPLDDQALGDGMTSHKISTDLVNDLDEESLMLLRWPSPAPRSWWQLLDLYALPCMIIAVGVGCSAAGLYVGIRDVYNSLHSR